MPSALSGSWTRTSTAGVVFAEPPDQIRHRVDRERRERGELEPSGLQLDDPGDRVSCFVDRSQHLARRTDQRLPRRGQAQATPDPMEQLRAQLRLQPADGLGERRLGHVQPSGGAGHAALFDHREEVAEPAFIHR